MNLAVASCYHGPAMARTAGIILIGNELLSGKVADANAVYLCRELRALGVDVRRIVVIPDEIEKIAQEVAEFSRSFDVVFTSGGVGPTHDDVTIEGIARAFGVPVVRDPAMVAALERLLRRQPQSRPHPDGRDSRGRGAHDRGRRSSSPR